MDGVRCGDDMAGGRSQPTPPDVTADDGAESDPTDSIPRWTMIQSRQFFLKQTQSPHKQFAAKLNSKSSPTGGTRAEWMKCPTDLALRHDVEVHPLRIKDQIRGDGAALVHGDVAVLGRSFAAVRFAALHHQLSEKNLQKENV